MITVYADYFTEKKRKKAKKILQGDKFIVSPKDLVIVAFLNGGSFLMVVFTIAQCLMLDSRIFRDELLMLGIKAFNPLFRVAFIIIYIILATGVVIRVYREKEINYLHIFEISYEYKIYEWEFWKTGSFLLFAWTFCFAINFLLNVNSVRESYKPTLGPVTMKELPADYQKLDLVLILFICCFVLACVQPFFNCFYRHARYELGVTLLYIFKAPFAYVRFRDFFMADILCSIKGSLMDIGYMAYYFGNGNF